MKSLKEMYEALISGKTLISDDKGIEVYVDLESKLGPFVLKQGSYKRRMFDTWSDYESFSIKK